MLVTGVNDPKLRFSHAGMPKVSDAKHKAKPAIVWSYNQAVAEKDARSRTREANEDKARYHSEPDHADKNLDGYDDVAVKRDGIVMAVPNGRQSFDAKKEGERKRSRLQIVDTIRTYYVKRP